MNVMNVVTMRERWLAEPPKIEPLTVIGPYELLRRRGASG
jgi:hypothetical protein